MTVCPKCQKTSGDDWSQCDGVCPMSMSPYFQSLDVFPKIDPEKEVINFTPPRRLSMDPASPHYRPFEETKKVGVRFKGVEKKNVYEYDADEGWVRLLTGTRGTDRQGKPFTVKLQGRVEPYWRKP